MSRFVGKTAIVTGGSRGLGFAIATRLGQEGAEVLITGRTAASLESAVSQLHRMNIAAWAVSGDVASAVELDQISDAAIDRWGHIDVLVNNAGLADEAAFLDISRQAWDYIIAAMLTGPFILSQRVAQEMVRRGGGAIVNVASIDGHVADGPFASYGAAKAGLQALTRYIAVELADRGVRCNSISPGWVDTPMVEADTDPALLAIMRRDFTRVPLRRLLTADEVAAAVAFLASDEASGITGTDLVVDGGTLADGFILPALEAISRSSRSA